MTRFAAVASRRHPALDDLLLAAAGELRPVDPGAVRERLDDDARALFGLAALAPRDQAQQLATVLDGELALRADAAPDPDLLALDRVLATRRGHPALLACVASELARRAGVRAHVCRAPGRWFVGVGFDEGPAALLDCALRAGCARPPAAVHPCCPHGLAFWVLTELARHLGVQGRRREARRASALRLALPVDPRSRAAVEAELAQLDAAESAPFRRHLP